MVWKIGRRTAVLAAALLAASCGTTPAPKPTAQSNGKAPHAAPQVEAQAAAFVGSLRKLSEPGPSFSNAASVAAGVQAGAAYEPKQLEAGLIAFAAVAALQEPGYVAGVRKAAAKEGSQALARRIAANPAAAQTLPGASAAAGRARGALARQASALSSRGEVVKAASYSVQRQKWSKAKVADASGRLSRVKATGRSAYRAGEADQAQLYRAVAEGGSRGGGANPVVTQGLAAAALSVLDDDRGAGRMLSEPRAGMCVRMAKLNFHQCLASAGPYYEDLYCLGRHAMLETSSCVSQAASGARLASR
jgi:hypothetical protein